MSAGIEGEANDMLYKDLKANVYFNIEDLHSPKVLIYFRTAKPG